MLKPKDSWREKHPAAYDLLGKNADTQPKTNMDTQNHGLEKVTLLKHQFLYRIYFWIIFFFVPEISPSFSASPLMAPACACTQWDEILKVCRFT